jgi:hypothetical protein
MKSVEEMLLMEAANEINLLRDQNQRQAVRLEAIDDMLYLAKAKPPIQNIGYAEDIAQKIERYLKQKENDKVGFDQESDK